jgi:hypothetical protein
MGVDIGRTIAFVRERATPVEAARLEYVLTQQATPAEVLRLAGRW